MEHKLTAGSLFSGIGGIDLAFSLAGFDILFQVEIDKFCQQVLAKHSKEYWPNAATFNDVRGVGKHNLPTVDILFGGFPCQDVSNAGKREGLVAGKRSSLWFEFARIIGEIRPRVVLLENVAGITTPRKGENGELRPPDMAMVIDTLASMGYSARWGIIAASDAGAPHQRKRWFCMAYTERRGLFSTPATRKSPYQQNGNAEIEQFTGGTFSRAIVPSHDLLREQNGMANTNSQRCTQNGEHRAETSQRASRASQLGNPKGTGRKGRSWGKVRSFVFTDSIGRCGRVSIDGDESRMGRKAHGISPKLDGARLMAHRWPARPNEAQHEDEPPRLVGDLPNRRNRVKALGNGVSPQVVYPIALEIVKFLEGGVI